MSTDQTAATTIVPTADGRGWGAMTQPTSLIELWQAPGGRTHLCWLIGTQYPRAACRTWWPNLDTWLPLLDGGEITCRTCRRTTTRTHVPAWSLPEVPPDRMSPTVEAVRARWAAGLPATGGAG